MVSKPTFNTKLEYGRFQKDRAEWRRQLETTTDPEARAELHHKLVGNRSYRP